MGKGDQYHPVDQDKYNDGYKRAFGLCKSDQCTYRLNCVRWLQTMDMFGSKNVYEFYNGESPCEFYVECKTKNPDEQELE